MTAEYIQKWEDYAKNSLSQYYTNPKKLHNFRFLVVEDNELYQLLTKQVLEAWGGEVILADDGQKCLDILKQQKIDLVLMDMQMPVLSGWEATKQIRQNMQMDLPIIALTASKTAEEEARGLESGVNFYLNKPFDRQDLWQKITYLLVK